MGISDDELKAIEARANAAMPGPLHVGHVSETEETVELDTPDGLTILSIHSRNDEGFYCHARTDIPALIADLRAAREALRDADDFLGRACTWFVRNGDEGHAGKCREVWTSVRKALGEEK